ncbi:hypothetical protein PQX77_010620 [Marasmius sp. AFHP31]|nr:hypothetical protein PQX77_010620 [Marasmius sp. AFHP31]
MTSSLFANAQNLTIGDNGDFSVVGRDQYNNYNQLTLASESQRRRIIVGNAEEEALYAEYRDLRLGDVLIINDLGYILEWEWDESYGGWAMVCERNFSVAQVRSGIYSVVSYDGPRRVEGWREDFERFSGISLRAQGSVPQTYFRICDTVPNNVQVYGINRSNNPLLALYNDLSPLAHFLDRAARRSLVTQDSGALTRMKKYTVVTYGGSRGQDQWKKNFRRFCRDQTSRDVHRTDILSSTILINVPPVLVLNDAIPFFHVWENVSEESLWMDARGELVLYDFQVSAPNFRLPSGADLMDDRALLRYMSALSLDRIFGPQLWNAIAGNYENWSVELSDITVDQPTIMSNVTNATIVVETGGWGMDMGYCSCFQSGVELPDGKTR